jgi:hypothetical protein
LSIETVSESVVSFVQLVIPRMIKSVKNFFIIIFQDLRMP